MNGQSYRSFYHKSWALVIGINDYAYVNKLENARADAESVAELLIKELGFLTNNVILLLDSEATKAQILARFLSFESLNQDDRVFLFFAGHGETVPGQRGDVGYLVPVDGRLEDKSTLIRWGELTSSAEIIPAKHILFVMDACYSGLAIQRGVKAGAQRFVSDMLQRVSRQVMTAGKADQPVSDGGGPSGSHSVFTGHLLEGLSGKAADQHGVLTATGLMSYVYHKVAADVQSQQTPHYGHVFGDGDFILRTPDNGHLASSGGQDFLVEVLPERPEALPSAALTEVVPVFAAKNGYGDPDNANFGQNDWTAKLGIIKHKGGSKSQLVPAKHWLALVAEPVSNQKIDFDILSLAKELRGQSRQSQQSFENFQLPSQFLTTANNLIFFDGDRSDDGSGIERWKRFLRIDRRGSIEYCEYPAAAMTRYAGRNSENEGTPVRVFNYVQAVALIWQFLFAVKRILQRANYEGGVRILVNLVGAKDTLLVNFARAEGLERKFWRDPFDMESMMGGSLENWKCRDANFQAEFQCALASLGEAESKKLIIRCAQQFGLAFNHQSTPRCFNYGTEVFPWAQVSQVSD